VILISGYDFLKQLTERVTSYINDPTKKQEKNIQDSEKSQSGYSSHWFGVLPFAIKTFINNKKSRKP